MEEGLSINYLIKETKTHNTLNSTATEEEIRTDTLGGRLSVFMIERFYFPNSDISTLSLLSSIDLH